MLGEQDQATTRGDITCAQNTRYFFFQVIYQCSFFFFQLFIYLFLAGLGLHCCADFSLVAGSRGYSTVAVRGLLIAVASLIAEYALQVYRLL